LGVIRAEFADCPQAHTANRVNEIIDTTDRLLDRAQLHTAYYANSYVCDPDDTTCVTAWSVHEGDRFPR